MRGLGSVPAHKSGITLIALIITIIVMLILVGVTINVVLNGGLFIQAQTAANDTQMNADREQLLTAVVASYDIETETISESELRKNLGNGWTVIKESSVYKVTSPKGNVFTVDENGNITSDSENGVTSQGNSTVPDELEKYIMGENKTGKTLFCSYDAEGNRQEDGIIDLMTLSFVQNPSNENSTIHKLVKLTNNDFGENIASIRYKRDLYTFEVDENYCSVKGTLKKVYAPEGNLGKYVKYKDLTWIVLYETNEKMELISADALGTVTLGFGDERALENIQVIDKDNLTDEEKFNVAVWSYNNLIETLTLKCKELTGIQNEIRNVGGMLKDDENNLTDVNLEYLQSNGFGLRDGYETKMETLLNGIKREINNNFENDNKQMNKLGITLADNCKGYLLNGRDLRCSESWTFLSVQRISGSIIDNTLGDLVRFNTFANYTTWSYEYNVRPIISLNKSLLNNSLGDGTIDDPVIISD